MASESLAAYRRLLGKGGHDAAIRELARRLDVDPGTAERVIKRAAREEHRPRPNNRKDT